MALEYDNVEKFMERMEFIISKVGGIPELAKRSGLSQTVIHKYKRGESDPSRERLNSLAEAADVSMEWLGRGLGKPGKYERVSWEHVQDRYWAGLSDSTKSSENDPYLPDPEFVRIMTARSFSRDTIALAVAELVAYIRDKSLDIDPKKTGDLAAQLCEMARDENGVDAASVERLLKFKNLL